MAEQRNRLDSCRRRVSEFETIFCRINEDNALSKLPDNWYQMLDAQYLKEQSELEGKIERLHKTVENESNEELSAAKFIAFVKRYQVFEKMTTTMLNEFLERILVHERKIKDSSESPQTIEVCINFIGQFRSPDSAVPLTADEQVNYQRKYQEKSVK